MKSFSLAILILLTVQRTTLPAHTAWSPIPWRIHDPRLSVEPAAARPLRSTLNPSEQQRENRIGQITKELRSQPHHTVLTHELADLYVQESRYDEAAGLYYRIARRDGADREALSGLAICMIRLGSHEAARRLLNEMRERSIALPQDILTLAHVQYLAGEMDAAYQTLRSLVLTEEKQALPDPAMLENAWFNLAVVAYSLNNIPDAEAWLQKVRQSDDKP